MLVDKRGTPQADFSGSEQIVAEICRLRWKTSI
jgi:hypothetical protein